MAIQFGTTDFFGISAYDWCVIKSTYSEKQDSTANKCTNGDYNDESSEIATFNDRTEVTVTYQVKSDISPDIVLGRLYGGYTVTELSVDQQYNDWAKITLTGHKHVGFTHTVSEYTISTPDLGFGVEDEFSKEGAEVSATSMTWSAVVDHIDRQGNQGDVFAGISRGCRINCTINYLGDCGDSDVTGWTRDDYTKDTSNEDFINSSFVAHKFQSVD